VTTMPLFKLPIHMSYLLYLGQFSPALAAGYFRFALGLCRLTGVEPSILLHPLDFLGAEDDQDLSFFPAMKLPAATKTAMVEKALDQLAAHYRIVPMREHAAAVRERLRRPARAGHAPAAQATGA
jgi:peptidoglycan-N-acetylglucosamine deacetylase